MSSNGRASLCLGSKQDAKGIIPNNAPNKASRKSIGIIMHWTLGTAALRRARFSSIF
jgi:hypothetical protein